MWLVGGRYCATSRRGFLRIVRRRKDCRESFSAELGRTFGRSIDVAFLFGGACLCCWCCRGTEERMSTLRADAAAFVPCSEPQQSHESSSAICSSLDRHHPPNKNHRRRPRRRIQSTNNAKKGRAGDEQSRSRKEDSQQQGEVVRQQRHRGPKTTKRQTTGERMLGRRREVSVRQRDATGNNPRRSGENNDGEGTTSMLEPTLFPALVRNTKSTEASSENLGQPQALVCWSETSAAIRAPPLAAHGISDDSEEQDGIFSWVTNKELDLLPPLMMRRTGTAALGKVRSNDPQPPIPTGSAADEPVCSALARDAGDPASIVDKESLEKRKIKAMSRCCWGCGRNGEPLTSPNFATDGGILCSSTTRNCETSNSSIVKKRICESSATTAAPLLLL